MCLSGLVSYTWGRLATVAERGGFLFILSSVAYCAGVGFARAGLSLNLSSTSLAPSEMCLSGLVS